MRKQEKKRNVCYLRQEEKSLYILYIFFSIFVLFITLWVSYLKLNIYHANDKCFQTWMGIQVKYRIFVLFWFFTTSFKGEKLPSENTRILGNKTSQVQVWQHIVLLIFVLWFFLYYCFSACYLCSFVFVFLSLCCPFNCMPFLPLVHLSSSMTYKVHKKASSLRSKSTA